MIQHMPTHSEEHPVLDKIIETLRAQRQVKGATWAQRRLAMEAVQAQLALPKSVTVEATKAGGVKAAWIRPSTSEAADRAVILYLHGGGYVLGSITTLREAIGRLAVATNANMLGVDYRLAPENPFPAAVDDAAAAYRWLLSQGTPANRIIVAGDSAGGGLAVATLLRLRESGDPMPAGAVLLSPWVDLTSSGESLTTRKDADPMVGEQGLVEMANAYAAGRLHDSEASPLFAELSGLPPCLIHVGDAEVLLDDSLRLAQALRDAGGDAKVEVWDRMIHVFQAFPQLPEAAQSLERIGTFVNEQIGH